MITARPSMHTEILSQAVEIAGSKERLADV
jgi:hypothetical protein